MSNIEVTDRETRFNPVRYMLNGHERPPLTETVYVAELARRAIQSIYGAQNNGSSSPALSGKTPNGKPEPSHSHAYFLPTDEDGDGRLDHLTVHCERGFSIREIRAFEELREIRHTADGMRIDVVLVDSTQAVAKEKYEQCPLLSLSIRWCSVTPFIPSRHHKKRGQKRDTCSPEEFSQVALREDIHRKGLPVPVTIHELYRCQLRDHGKRESLIGSLSWLEFRRKRVFGIGRRGLHPGSGFAVEFSEPVPGPLALGYGCHFGLGLFAPAG